MAQSENPRAVSGSNSANAQLASIVDRFENLETERKAISEDMKEVLAEAKGNGYDVKALREILRRRKQDKDDLAEHEAIVDTYLVALGMV